MDPRVMAALLHTTNSGEGEGSLPQPEAQILELFAWRDRVAGRCDRKWEKGELCRMLPGVGNIKEVLKPHIVWMFWQYMDMKGADLHLAAMAQTDRSTMSTLPCVDCIVAQWDARVGCLIFQLFWTGGLELWGRP